MRGGSLSWEKPTPAGAKGSTAQLLQLDPFRNALGLPSPLQLEAQEQERPKGASKASFVPDAPKPCTVAPAGTKMRLPTTAAPMPCRGEGMGARLVQVLPPGS